MVRACLDVFLQPLPCLRDGFHLCLLETNDSCPYGSGFAQGKEFGEEYRGALAPCVNSFLVLVKPLFRLPHKGKGKQAEPDGVRCDIFYDDGVAQLKEVLEMSVGVLIGQSTEGTSLHHSD